MSAIQIYLHCSRFQYQFVYIFEDIINRSYSICGLIAYILSLL